MPGDTDKILANYDNWRRNAGFCIEKTKELADALEPYDMAYRKAAETRKHISELILFDGIPHVEDEGLAGTQYTPRRRDGHSLVRTEHDAELANNNVKGSIGKRETQSADLLIDVPITRLVTNHELLLVFCLERKRQMESSELVKVNYESI